MSGIPRRVFAPTIVAVVLAAGASSAQAAVTIGQVDPAAAPATACVDNRDAVQSLPVTAYRVPAEGTITSWTTNGRALAGQMAMKIFRKIAEPNIYQVVAHDGPRPLSAAGGLQTFPVNIAVKTGDQLGVSTPPAGSGMPACAFSSPGDLLLNIVGNLADGQSEAFNVENQNLRANIRAVFVPTNTFTIGVPTRNKKKGTASVAVTVPNPGEVAVGGTGVKEASGARISVAVGAPGIVTVPIKAKGKKKKKLKQNGKVKLSPTITYTPTGGTALTQSLKLKLRKKLKK